MKGTAVELVGAAGGEQGATRALVAFLVAGLACLLGLLPVAIALGILAPPPAYIGSAAAALGGTVLAVKSVVITWSLLARAWSAHKGSVAVAYVD